MGNGQHTFQWKTEDGTHRTKLITATDSGKAWCIAYFECGDKFSDTIKTINRKGETLMNISEARHTHSTFREFEKDLTYGGNRSGLLESIPTWEYQKYLAYVNQQETKKKCKMEKGLKTTQAK